MSNDEEPTDIMNYLPLIMVLVVMTTLLPFILNTASEEAITTTCNQIWERVDYCVESEICRTHTEVEGPYWNKRNVTIYEMENCE